MLKYIKQLKQDADNAEEKIVKEVLSGLTMKIHELDGAGGEILKLSKGSINSSVNDDLVGAKKTLDEASEKIIELDKNITSLRKALGDAIVNSGLKISDLLNIKLDHLENDFSNANEEYLEAYILYFYLKSKKGEVVKPESGIPCDFRTYAGGLCDFCGELLRKAKLDIINTKNPIKEIERYYADTKKIYEALSVFAFSNKSGVRSKVEQLKGHIIRFEDMLYEMRDK